MPAVTSVSRERPAARLLTLAADPRVALAWWGLVAAIITVSVLWNPGFRSIYYLHPEAARNWWAGRPLYSDGIDFFQYLPQSAILHTPFALLGSPIGDVMWRWLGMGLMLLGLRRMAPLVAPERSSAAFAVMALLTLIPSLSSIQNGQPNLQVAGVMLHAALDLATGRVGRGAMLLVLALVVKPVALVLVLLCGALFTPLRRRLALWIAIVALVPFFTQAPGYVVDQYAGALAKMLRAAQPDRNTFTDLNGIWWTLTGDSLDRGVLLLVQVAAALGTLLLGWIAVARRSAAEAPLAVWLLACLYLMLFNPRNESNAFVIVAPALAAFAAQRLVGSAPDRRAGGAAALAAVLLGATGLTGPLNSLTTPWLKPAIVAVFALVAVRALLRDRPLMLDRPPAPQAQQPSPA